MSTPHRRKIFKWLAIIAGIYIFCGIILYSLQDKFLFHPQPLPSNHVYRFPLPFRELNLPVNNEKNLSIVQFTVPDSVCKGVVLYFHGNRQHIARYAGFAGNFTKQGYEVWMPDYPGFGKSTGKRTEAIIYSDAEELYKMARARFAKDSIIIYGKSLGTGPATYLASRRDCQRLILETPFYSMDALVSHYAFIYPVGALLRYHFPSNEYIERVDAPVSIFHGTNDGLIPYEQAKKLQALTKPGSELITIRNGRHNNLNDFLDFHQKLDSLLSIRH